MASTTNQDSARSAAYSRPEIADYGSLEALTADFDLHFVGSAAKLITMAVASGPSFGGGGDPPPAEPSFSGGGPPPLTDGGTTPDAGGLPGGGEVTPDAPSPDSGTLGEGPEDGRGESPDGGSGNLPGSAESTGGAGVREEVAGAAGLPFTGYAAWATAAIGAAMTTSGVILRDMLRRRR